MTDIKIVSIEDIVSELKNPEQENTVRLLENACVSAGAGSGKTRVLATRYVYLVAKYGYTEWLGQHYIDDGKNKVTESYSDRKEFLSKMDLSSLKEMDTDEKFTETFIYTHDDNSKWKGTLYFEKDIQTGIYEGEHVLYMTYVFMLEPIK
jgi:hypothetical protein